ncbi:neopentalenolactone D synthase [Aspergillus udagawae]|uniref:Neopentalenolactone D synthase n=1 Tax=Aspergillus udagawae TaxID=91492 RepID=A0A8H3SB23_9EURO|nr:neopentalenolactone D synthase [Aspergillus udagawae]
MEGKWNNGLATLHGVITRDLPNLFFSGTAQAGACANMTYILDQSAIHVAYILSKAKEGASEKCPGVSKVIIEPTAEAEEDWAMEVVSRVAALRGIAGSQNSKEKAARLAVWGEGIASYVNQIETWRKEGKLHGLELTYLEEDALCPGEWAI